MPVLNWTRTSMAAPGRGGAMVTGFDNELMQNAPLTDAGVVTEEQLWDNLKYFLEKVVPVAEEAGVRLAMHPDDPPLSPLRGMGRIMRSVENYQRLIDLVPSPANGICLCQGNFTLMTDDLPERHPPLWRPHLFRPLPRCARHARKVRRDLSRRRQNRHARLHGSLPRHRLRGRPAP